MIPKKKRIRQMLKNNPKLKSRMKFSEQLRYEKYLEDKKLEDAVIKRSNVFWEDGEIIGNVHENKELLEVSE